MYRCCGFPDSGCPAFAGITWPKAGVEMALWDLIGKRDGKSLRDMLGGMRDKVEVGVSVGLQESPETLVRKRGRLRESRLRTHEDQDQTRTGYGRGQRSPKSISKHPLQVDANSAYSLETCQALRPMDELKLLLIEQPLSRTTCGTITNSRNNSTRQFAWMKASSAVASPFGLEMEPAGSSTSSPDGWAG